MLKHSKNLKCEWQGLAFLIVFKVPLRIPTYLIRVPGLESWFRLHFQLLAHMHPCRQQVMAQISGSLTTMWEPHLDFPALCFNLTSPSHGGHLGSEPLGARSFLTVSFNYNINKENFKIWVALGFRRRIGLQAWIWDSSLSMVKGTLVDFARGWIWRGLWAKSSRLKLGILGSRYEHQTRVVSKGREYTCFSADGKHLVVQERVGNQCKDDKSLANKTWWVTKMRWRKNINIAPPGVRP